MGFLSFFENIGTGIKRGFEDFGVKARKGFETAGKFIVDKVAPVVKQIAGGVGTAASFLAPALAFTPFAEFAPIVAGVGAGARALSSAIDTGQKVVQVAGEAVRAVQRPVIEKAASMVSNMARNPIYKSAVMPYGGAAGTLRNTLMA
jgi:hypothetical protein